MLLPRLSTIDLAYQIRAGEFMLNTHTILRTDLFSFTALGSPWMNQQWGAQLLFAMLFRLGRWPGLILSRVALAALVYAFVYLSCRSSGASTRLSAALTFASFGVSAGGLILRPQLLGMALFATFVWLAASREAHPRRLLCVLPLMAVWANVHGSFVLGPVTLGLAYLEDRRRRSTRATKTLWLALASAAVACLNPFGLRVWKYALSIGTNPEITRAIVEWRPTSVRVSIGLLFFLSVAAVAAILARRGHLVSWPSLLTLGLFFFLGLFAIRGIYWWALAAPPVVAGALAAPPRGQAHDNPSSLNTGIAAGLLALALFFLPWWRGGGPDFQRGLLDHAPLGLTARLEQVLGPGRRMFNPQIWGSWLELALPEHRTFVDARIEVFPDTVWRDYDGVSIGRDGWQRILERWRVDVVVAHRGQQSKLIPLILRDPGWRLDYRDREGYIFVRASG
jgi:hypothetical protein